MLDSFQHREGYASPMHRKRQPYARSPNHPPPVAALAALAALLLGALVALAPPISEPQTAAAATQVKQIEVGLNHACALDYSGSVTCWGDDTYGQVTDWGKFRYRAKSFTSIAAGGFLTCGIDTTGSLMCWGYPENENGTIRENNTKTWSNWYASPDSTFTGWVLRPPTTVKFKPDSISVGNYHACGIKTDGELICWGKAGSARLVVPKDSNSNTITDWTMVEAGWAQNCGIRSGGSVVCFGRTSYDRSAGPSGSGPFTDVTTGVYNGCALASNGSVECWGGTGISVLDPVKVVPTGVTFASIEMSTANGYYHTCGLATDGKVHCWGVTGTAQLAPPSGSYAKISVGGPAACVLNSNGYLDCWGDDFGPVFSPPSGQFTQVSGGTHYGCALNTSEQIKCWGAVNGSEQLNAPTGQFKFISVGHNHGCAIKKSDNTVACWGASVEWHDGRQGGRAHRYLLLARRRRRHHLRGQDRQQPALLGCQHP